ncbi:DNA methyltransferase [Klebsiella variicola subsp. variicola]|uniref:MT-A70 family methyltransferase n=1 Tax=Klebsiella variicola TaxID=244366 RepID=UPI001E4B7821|nr:MT-A70 family methyltransferase [Klebsiella variicola]MCD9775834.1 DNA methyltransferase [Klebsiella variicola subsp. variicola]
MMKYSLIYCDPAWSYDNKGSRAAAENHYSTMTITDLKRLPVWELAADDAVLVMWWVPPMPLEAIELAEAWGFRVKNMCLFTWAKLNERALDNLDRELAGHHENVGALDSLDFLELLNGQTRMGLGNYTRGNSESALVAVKGRGLERQAGNVKQMIYAPLGAHSAKPAEARNRLERLYGDVPRIELFSRCAAPGWHHWGNQCGSDAVQLIPGGVIHPERWSHDNGS